MLLSQGAKRLVVAFIVLGAIGLVAQQSIEQHFIGQTVGRSEARDQLQRAYTAASAKILAFQPGASCNDAPDKVRCITVLDGKLATVFDQFHVDLDAIDVPSGYAAQFRRLDQLTTRIADDLGELATTTSLPEYEDDYRGLGLPSALRAFDTDVTRLLDALN